MPVASSSSQALGILIIPISDGTGLGGEEAAILQEDRRQRSPARWPGSGESRKREPGAPRRVCVGGFPVKQQRLITANFLPLARTANPQGFHKVFVYLALSARLALGTVRDAEEKKQHGLP